MLYCSIIIHGEKDMRIHRMFEIVYVLLEEGRVTARQLADRFEVSTRTIYRDIENISAAGIPIYMVKGKNGGIGLLKGYTIDKSVLSDEERQNIISALKSYNYIDENKGSDLLSKLGLFLGEKNESYIEVDLMDWGSRVREAYDISKKAILERRVISFDYLSPSSGLSRREVEPYKLYFKASTWYLKSYCLNKESQRLFRLSRMKNIEISDKYFEGRILEEFLVEENMLPKTKVKLIIDKTEEFRVLDEFSSDEYKRNSDGNFEVETEMFIDNWVIGYILSFGSKAVVISPEYVRERIKKSVKKSFNNYFKYDDTLSY